MGELPSPGSGPSAPSTSVELGPSQCKGPGELDPMRGPRLWALFLNSLLWPPGLLHKLFGGGVRSLSVPVHAKLPLGRPGTLGEPVEKRVTLFKGEAGSKTLGLGSIPSKELTGISWCQGHVVSSELGQGVRLWQLHWKQRWIEGHLAPIPFLPVRQRETPPSQDLVTTGFEAHIRTCFLKPWRHPAADQAAVNLLVSTAPRDAHLRESAKTSTC